MEKILKNIVVVIVVVVDDDNKLLTLFKIYFSTFCNLWHSLFKGN